MWMMTKWPRWCRRGTIFFFLVQIYLSSVWTFDCDFCSVYYQVTTAFVGNLPENINEEYLRKLFEQFGEVGPNGRHISAVSTNQFFAMLNNYDLMCNQVTRVAISRKGQCPVGFVHFASRSVSFYLYLNSEDSWPDRQFLLQHPALWLMAGFCCCSQHCRSAYALIQTSVLVFK